MTPSFQFLGAAIRACGLSVPWRISIPHSHRYRSFCLQDVESVGMVIKDVITIIDREEGGVQRLSDRGLTVHALLSLSQVFIHKIILFYWWWKKIFPASASFHCRRNHMAAPHLSHLLFGEGARSQGNVHGHALHFHSFFYFFFSSVWVLRVDSILHIADYSNSAPE